MVTLLAKAAVAARPAAGSVHAAAVVAIAALLAITGPAVTPGCTASVGAETRVVQLDLDSDTKG